MTENIKIVRKHFVYLLNYALDVSKKEIIESGDLVSFSNEVKKFNHALEEYEIPDSIKTELKQVSFSYSPNRENLSDSLFFVFKYTFANWAIQKHRTMLLNDFLKKFDGKLKLLD
ncbi:hypothetical protein [Elizabethkingia meningoseptica]|uniref:hypothetical protein n=1 Tax=Elizabethkingia meningoseptica TaxID=238 RepID=UPI003891C710